MSNVGAQNRFLQSNLTSNGLASETTLKKVVDAINGIPGNNLETGPGDSTDAQRVVIANDNPDLAVKTSLESRLHINNPSILFRSHFGYDTQPNYWDYNVDWGTGVSQSFGSSTKSLNLTTTTDALGSFNMTTNDSYNCSGTNNILIFTLKPVLSTGTGQSINENILIGMRDITDNWGFQFAFRGNDSYTFNISADSGDIQVAQGSWNISTVIQGSRDAPMTIYFEFNDDAVILGEIYEGIKNPLHRHSVSDEVGSKYFHFVEIPILIRIVTGLSYTGWVSEIYNIRLIQEYKQPIIDLPYANNYMNYYSRTGRNDGTIARLEGAVDSINNSTFRQCSYGLSNGEYYDLPTTQTDLDIQISCDSTARTTQQLIITANQVDGTTVQSNAVTLNGRNAVNVTFPNSSQIYRLVSMIVIVNTMNGDYGLGVGDYVYISPQGQTLSSGVPDAQIMGTMSLGVGIAKMGYFHLKPNTNFVALKANLTQNSASLRSVRFALQYKSCSVDLWMTFFNSGFGSDVSMDLPSTEILNGGSDGVDMRIIVTQGVTSGAVDNTSITIHGNTY